MSLKTMYPPQKDSPSTFLLGDISTTDTLMTVANAATLPQTMPYPLTIGIDKAVTETVMVTATNLGNNQLTITRGTPAYVWLAGSKVARVLTAKDFKDVQDNVADINTALTTAQSTIATQGTDISTLKTTVGNASSGLVKNLADEVTRAKAAETSEATRATTAEGVLTSGKINRTELAQVITDWAYSADGTQLLVTINRYNASTQQATQYTRTLPVVSAEAMGVMTPEAYNEITALRNDVNTLTNLGGRFIGVSFATKAALTSYVVPASVKTGDFTYVLDDETKSGSTTRYVRNGTAWDFTFVIDYDPVGLANSATAGIVKSDSGSTVGKVFVEVNGTMSVIGWDAMDTAVAAAQSKADAAIPGNQKGVAGGVALYDTVANLKNSKSARFIIGTSTSDWTTSNCDYLCDGTDDQVEINAAITALPAAGGKIIILDGTYNITADITITSRSNISINGSGPNTILKRMSDSAAGVISLATSVACIIEDLVIDGNKAVYYSGTGRGIQLSTTSANTSIKNVICKNNSDIGIRLYSGTYSKVEGCTVNDNGMSGINVGSNANHSLIVGNNCFNNVVGINAASTNTIVTNNYCHNNSQDGIGLGGANCVISNNQCEYNTSCGITSANINSVITDNSCNNNYYGIKLYNAAAYNSVSGNTSYNNDIGIILIGVTNNSISSNTCIRNTGVPGDYTESQYTIQLSGSANNYNLISSNQCMGKNVVSGGGIGNILMLNKWDTTDSLILAGQMVANATAVATYGTAQVRNISGGTADLTAGVSALPTGDVYFVFE